jgi:hypothetical protein
VKTINFNLTFMDDKHHPLKAVSVYRNSSRFENVFRLENGEEVIVRDCDVKGDDLIEASDTIYVVITKEYV